MRRREFLQRAALTGGLAMGMAGLLQSRHDPRRGGEARAGSSVPDPRNVPLDTIVVLMMENRSFDHYLGWLPGADGRQGRARLRRTPPAQPHETHRLAPDWQGCAHPDPDHSW